MLVNFFLFDIWPQDTLDSLFGTKFEEILTIYLFIFTCCMFYFCSTGILENNWSDFWSGKSGSCGK